MATVVNNPGSGSGNGAGGWIIAGVLIVVAALVAIFVWPGYGRQASDATQINVQIPSPDMGGDAAQ